VPSLTRQPTRANLPGPGTMHSGNSKRGVPSDKMSKAVTRAKTINYLRGSLSRRSISEGDLAPAELTTKLFERAGLDLREDVMEMLCAAFEAFAVEPPAVPEVKVELNRSGTHKAPHKAASPLSQKRERGVPFEDIPLFLDALGCYTHPDMVRAYRRARLASAVLFGTRGMPCPVRSGSAFADSLCCAFGCSLVGCCVSVLICFVACGGCERQLTDEIFWKLGIVRMGKKAPIQQQQSTIGAGAVVDETQLDVPEQGHIPSVGLEKMIALVWHFLVEAEISDEDLKVAFNTFDADGDGTLQSGELKQVRGLSETVLKCKRTRSRKLVVASQRFACIPVLSVLCAPAAFSFASLQGVSGSVGCPVVFALTLRPICAIRTCGTSPSLPPTRPPPPPSLPCVLACVRACACLRAGDELAGRRQPCFGREPKQHFCEAGPGPQRHHPPH
jgi:hypothetical protein